MAAGSVTPLFPPAGQTTNSVETTFQFSVVSGNGSYSVELFIGGTGYNQTTIICPDSSVCNITTNSTVPEGTYNWVVNATNLTEVIPSAPRLITYDRTTPVCNFTSASTTNNANSTVITIVANVTELNPTTINFTLFNATAEVNRTEKGMLSYTDNTTFTWVSLAEGTYTYNYTVLDRAGQEGTSVTRTVIIDTVTPGLTVSSPATLTTDTDGTVEFNFTATDANTIANCSLYTSNTLNTTLTTIANGTLYNITLINMNQSDALEWYVKCSDAAGNMNTSATYTIDTLAAAATTTSTSTSTDGSTAAGTSSDDEEETEEVAEVTEENATVEKAECRKAADCISKDPTRKYACVAGECIDKGRYLGKKPPGPARAAEETGFLDTIKSWFVNEGTGDTWIDNGYIEYSSLAEEEAFVFTFTTTDSEDEEHTLTILDVNIEEQSVTLMLESEPKELTLFIGTPTYVDIDDNGMADLQIDLTAISEDGLIDLSFQKLEGWTGFEPTTNPTWAWWIVGILALLIIAGIIYWFTTR